MYLALITIYWVSAVIPNVPTGTRKKTNRQEDQGRESENIIFHCIQHCGGGNFRSNIDYHSRLLVQRPKGKNSLARS